MIPLQRGKEGEEKASSGESDGERCQKSPLAGAGAAAARKGRVPRCCACSPAPASPSSLLSSGSGQVLPAKEGPKGRCARTVRLCSAGEAISTYTVLQSLPKNPWQEGNGLETGVGKRERPTEGQHCALCNNKQHHLLQSPLFKYKYQPPIHYPSYRSLQRLGLIFTPEILQKRVFTFHNSTFGK